jgi:hypothetical protein
MRPLMTTLIADESLFQWIVAGSQVILAVSVLTLLLIWWIEFRNGRVW